MCIALSKQGPDTIMPEWIKGMDAGPDRVPLRQPDPRDVALGRQGGRRGRRGHRPQSDFPNQVNNSVGFPGIFRGTLDVRAKTITDEMCMAAAVELAKVAEDKGLSADYIMPTMDDWEVFPREAAAVAMKAIEQGIALRTDLTFEQEVAEATAIIARARNLVNDQMAFGYIPMPEGSRAPAPSKQAMKAAARGGVDLAGEYVDKAVDALGPAAPEGRPTRCRWRPTRRPRPSAGPPPRRTTRK